MIRRPPRSTLFPYTTPLPIYVVWSHVEHRPPAPQIVEARSGMPALVTGAAEEHAAADRHADGRSEEHTSELQSRQYLVCRLLLEKKNNISTSLLSTATNYQHL